VKAEAKPAVIEETAINDTTIHTPEIQRPMPVTGARSPYPTVVSVTRANHMPLPIPRM